MGRKSMDNDASRFGKMLMKSLMHSLMNRIVWRMPLVWAGVGLVAVLLIMWFTKMF